MPELARHFVRQLGAPDVELPASLLHKLARTHETLTSVVQVLNRSADGAR